MNDFLIWGAVSALLAILKLTGVIDWTWPIVALPVVIPLLVWFGIVIAAVIAWPFRRWAGAKSSHTGRD